MNQIDIAKLKLKELFKQSINEMEKVINDYDYILSHQENHLDDYILDIKNKIDIQREEVIQEIYKASNHMMQTLDDYYKKCIDNLPKLEKITEKTRVIISESRSKLNEKKIQLESNDMNESEIKLHVKDIRKNTLKYNQQKEIYDNELRMNLDYSFNPTKFESFRDIFGELDVKSPDQKPKELEFKRTRLFAEPSGVDFIPVVDLFDEKRLAVVNEKKHLLIFNLHTTECLQEIDFDDSAFITCLKWINKSKLILGFEDHLIKVLDLDNNGQCSKILSGHQAEIKRFCFNSEKNHLISATSCDNIKIWDLTSNFCIKNIPSEFDYNDVTSVGMLFNSKGKLITLCDKDNKIRIFNSDDDYDCELEFKYSHYPKVIQLTLDENICLLSQHIEIYDWKTGDRLTSINIFDQIEMEMETFVIKQANFISQSVIFLVSWDCENLSRTHFLDLSNGKLIESYGEDDYFIPVLFLKNGKMLVLQHWYENDYTNNDIERYQQLKIINPITYNDLI